MENTKNNIPIHAEQQFIQQKIKIPTNFIELKTVGKNYTCSTQGWPKQPVCEQYRFSANGKLVQIDIPHELMAKLELELGKGITNPIYISPAVLEKKPDEFGGITVNNEKDILLQTEDIILIQEKETQIDFTSSEITDLKSELEKSEQLSQETQKLLERLSKDNEEKHITIIFFEQQIKDLTQRITELRNNLENEVLAKKREVSKNQELQRVIKKLKEDEQVLIGLQNQISDLQRELGDQITNLTEERDKIKTNLNSLKNERNRLNDNLQTVQQERNRIQQELDNLKNEYRRVNWKFLSSWFKKSKKINDLKARIVRLGAELFDKDRQITDLRNNITNLNAQINQLTIERDNSRIQANDLGRTVRNQDQTITDLNNQIRQLTTQRDDLRIRENNLNNQVNGLNRTLGQRDQTITDLNNQIIKLNRDVNTWKSNYDNRQKEYETAQINYNYYYNEYRDKDREVDSLNGQISSLQSENSRLQEKSIDNYPKKKFYIINSVKIKSAPARTLYCEAWHIGVIGGVPTEDSKPSWNRYNNPIPPVSISVAEIEGYGIRGTGREETIWNG